MEENRDERGEAAWHVLWSPVGFGSTTAKLVELWQAAKEDDEHKGNTEMYFPTYLDRMRDGQEIQVPLFPNYVFLKCRWHVGLEDRIKEMSGIYALFLRMPGQDFPHRLSGEEMEGVKSALERRIGLVEQWAHVGDILIGDRVKVKNMDIIGEVMYFLPPHKAMIMTRFFNQEQTVPVKIAELEKL